MVRWPVVVLGVLLLMADGAAAGTVSLTKNRNPDIDSAVGPVTFRGSPGEESDLTVSVDAGNHLVFRDASNRLRAKGHCAVIATNTVRCDYTEEGARLKLGDGDDAVHNRVKETSDDVTMSVHASGGPGADTLIGAPVFDEIDGGQGDDTIRGRGEFDILTGGPDEDRISGGGGSDWLRDGESDDEAARDVVIGGAQDKGKKGDQYSYRGRTGPVTVSLADPAGGEDDLSDVESILGGGGPDVLTGDDGANVLDGGNGDDQIGGGDGNDRLAGKGGADKLDGEDGNDTVDGGEGVDELTGSKGDDLLQMRNDKDAADNSKCGDGADAIDSDPVDVAEADCEEFVYSLSGLSALTLPTLTQSKATFSIAFDDAGTITLTDPVGQLGTANFKLKDTKTKKPVEVPFDRPLAAPTLATVAFTYDGDDFGGYTMLMGGP